MKDIGKIVCEKDSGEFEKYTKKDMPLLLSCKEKAQNNLKKIGITEISKIEKINKMGILELMKKCSITNEVAEQIKHTAQIYLFSHTILFMLSQCEAEEVRVYEDGSVALMGTITPASGKEVKNAKLV